MKTFPWKTNPTIGWWLDNEPLNLYFGCFESDVLNIDRAGIPAQWTGMVVLFLDPVNAVNSVYNPFQLKCAAIHVHFSLRLFMTIFDSDLSGIRDKQKLVDKDRYEKFMRSDVDYYKGLYVRIRGNIPRRFITGVSYK